MYFGVLNMMLAYKSELLVRRDSTAMPCVFGDFTRLSENQRKKEKISVQLKVSNYFEIEIEKFNTSNVISYTTNIEQVFTFNHVVTFLFRLHSW